MKTFIKSVTVLLCLALSVSAFAQQRPGIGGGDTPPDGPGGPHPKRDQSILTLTVDGTSITLPVSTSLTKSLSLGSLALVATATSDSLPVSFELDATTYANISNDVLNLTAVGTVVLSVYQVGDDEWNPSDTVKLTINIVGWGVNTINIPASQVGVPINDRTIGTSDLFDQNPLATQFTYAAVGTLPAGITLSSAGVISGTPTQANSNTQTVAITVTDNFGATGSGSIVFAAIAKGDYSSIPAPTGTSTTYDPAKTLANVSLPSNYFWSDPTITPAVTNNGYAGYYNADPANYNNYPLTIALTVNKANYTSAQVTVPSGLTATYSPTGTLAAVTLPANYTWADATVVPTVTGGPYAAIYNGDPANYNNYSLNIPVTVAPAAQTLTFPSTTPTRVSINSTVTLSASSTSGLAVSYSVDDASLATVSGSTLTIGAATGTIVVTATVAHDDNYQDVTPITWTIDIAEFSLTSTISGGQVGESVSETSLADAVTAQGGVAPYSFALSSGSNPLPTGVTLDPVTGEISGTPTEAITGDYNVEIEVTDADGGTFTVSVTFAGGIAKGIVEGTDDDDNPVGISNIPALSAIYGTTVGDIDLTPYADVYGAWELADPADASIAFDECGKVVSLDLKYVPVDAANYDEVTVTVDIATEGADDINTATINIVGSTDYTGKQITPDVVVTLEGETTPLDPSEYTITYGPNRVTTQPAWIDVTYKCTTKRVHFIIEKKSKCAFC